MTTSTPLRTLVAALSLFLLVPAQPGFASKVGALGTRASGFAAQGAADPQRLFQERCAPCHGDDVQSAGNRAKAPSLSEIRQRGVSPLAVIRMIEGPGVMSQHARGWTADDRQRVAEWMTGQT